MSTIYRFKWDLPHIEVEATSLAEAERLAADSQEQYSSSNDGSELLANAKLIPDGTYECLHEDTRKSHYKFSRCLKAGEWEDMEGIYEYCKRCRKEVSKVETVLRKRPER